VLLGHVFFDGRIAALVRNSTGYQTLVFEDRDCGEGDARTTTPLISDRIGHGPVLRLDGLQVSVLVRGLFELTYALSCLIKSAAVFFLGIG